MQQILLKFLPALSGIPPPAPSGPPPPAPSGPPATGPVALIDREGGGRRRPYRGRRHGRGRSGRGSSTLGRFVNVS